MAFKGKYSRKYKPHYKRKSVKAIVKSVLKNQSETNHFDVSVAAADVDHNGIIAHLNPVVQGDDGDERIGMKVEGKALKFHGFFTPKFSAPNLDPYLCKVMIVVDTRQVDSTTPSVAAVLSTYGTAQGALSFANPDNLGRFKILKSKTFYVGGADYKSRVLDFYCPLKGLKSSFSAPAGTAITGNGIYLIAISQGVTAADPPRLAYYSRYSFTDM